MESLRISVLSTACGRRTQRGRLAPRFPLTSLSLTSWTICSRRSKESSKRELPWRVPSVIRCNRTVHHAQGQDRDHPRKDSELTEYYSKAQKHKNGRGSALSLSKDVGFTNVLLTENVRSTWLLMFKKHNDKKKDKTVLKEARLS